MAEDALWRGLPVHPTRVSGKQWTSRSEAQTPLPKGDDKDDESKPNWFLRLLVWLQIGWLAISVPLFPFGVLSAESSWSVYTVWSIGGTIWATFWSLWLYRSRSKAYPVLMMTFYGAGGVEAICFAVATNNPALVIGAAVSLLLLIFHATQRESFQIVGDGDGLAVLSVAGILVSLLCGFMSLGDHRQPGRLPSAAPSSATQGAQTSFALQASNDAWFDKQKVSVQFEPPVKACRGQFRGRCCWGACFRIKNDSGRTLTRLQFDVTATKSGRSTKYRFERGGTDGFRTASDVIVAPGGSSLECYEGVFEDEFNQVVCGALIVATSITDATFAE